MRLFDHVCLCALAFALQGSSESKVPLPGFDVVSLLTAFSVAVVRPLSSCTTPHPPPHPRCCSTASHWICRRSRHGGLRAWLGNDGIVCVQADRLFIGQLTPHLFCVSRCQSAIRHSPLLPTPGVLVSVPEPGVETLYDIFQYVPCMQRATSVSFFSFFHGAFSCSLLGRRDSW